VFGRLGEREARPYLGDLFFFGLVARLARPGPAARARPARRRGRRRHPAAPDPGRSPVLRGEADHVALSGIDRWVGGVHLQGPDAPWRWDEGTESVTP
jgi:hypothetical protein